MAFGIPSSFRSIDRILEQRRRVTSGGTTTTTTTGQIPPGSAAGGGFSAGPVAFSQTRAGLIFADETQRSLLTVQRENAQALARQQHRDDLVLQASEQKFQAGQLQKRLDDEAAVRAEERARARKANINQLRVERQGTFAALRKSGDQARAVIFALGFGPDNDVFDVRARALGTTVQELKGAQALRTTTQEALSRVLDRQVTIGREGVRGLGTAIGAARSFVQGGSDVRTLLQSAFGVGSLREGERPGMSAARLAELTQQVTPRGVLA